MFINKIKRRVKIFNILTILESLNKDLLNIRCYVNQIVSRVDISGIVTFIRVNDTVGQMNEMSKRKSNVNTIKRTEESGSHQHT